MGIKIYGIFFSAGVIVQTAKVLEAKLRKMIRKKRSEKIPIYWQKQNKITTLKKRYEITPEK